MSTDTTTQPAVRGIIALLAEDRGIDHVEPILARAGLGDEEIASFTGRDPSQVRAIIEDDSVAAPAARPQSVIDRARETLTRRASTS